MTLRKNEFVRTAFLNRRDAVLLVDENRRVLEANTAFLELFEYERDEVLSRQADFIYADFADFEKMSSLFLEPIRRTWMTYQVCYVTASGREIYAETRTLPIFADGATAPGAISVIRDQSPQQSRNRMMQRIAEEIAASPDEPNKLLNMALEIGREFCCADIALATRVMTEGQKVISTAPIFRDVPEPYSRSLASIVDVPCADVVDARRMVTKDQATGLRLNGYDRFVGHPVVVDGGVAGTLAFYGHGSGREMEPEDETALSVLAFSVAELLRRLEAAEGESVRRPLTAAERSEHQFARLYRTTPSIMHTMQHDGGLVEVSDHWLATTGYRRLEVIGRPFAEMLDDQSRALFNDLYMPGLRENGQITGVPLTMIGMDGRQLDIEMSAIVDHRATGEIIQVGLVDVTARNRAMDAVNEQNEKLERMINSLKEFSYVVSHDLQEPLRKMNQFSTFLLEDHAPALGESGRFYATSIASAATRMSGLIASLLGYSREANRTLKLRSVDLSGVIAEVLDDLQVAVEDSGAEVSVGQLPTVYADYAQMMSLFSNLVGNALKYRAAQRSPIVRVIPAPTDDRTTMIVVEDNGVGFDANEIEQIFKPFRRLHQHRHIPGNGIGLSLCRAICDRHGWELTAEGEPEQGARFAISMPMDSLASASSTLEPVEL